MAVSPDDDNVQVLRAAMRNATCMVDAGHAMGLGGRVEDEIAWVVCPRVPHPALNAVRPIRQHAGLVDRIPEIVGTFPDEVPVAWWVMSDDGHDELVEALTGHGFELSATMPALAGPIPAVVPEPPPGVALSPPLDAGDWDAAVMVQREGFDLPSETSATIVESIRALSDVETGPPTIDVVIARLGEEPVGIGFVSHRAGVAGMWSVTTLPSARGHGVGGAIIDQRFRLARQRGEEVAFMFSGGNAEPLYIARGFRRIGTCEFFVLSPRT